MNLLGTVRRLFHPHDPVGRQRVRDERIERNRAITGQLHEASVEARQVARAELQRRERLDPIRERIFPGGLSQ